MRDSIDVLSKTYQTTQEGVSDPKGVDAPRDPHSRLTAKSSLSARGTGTVANKMDLDKDYGVAMNLIVIETRIKPCGFLYRSSGICTSVRAAVAVFYRISVEWIE